MNNYEVCTPTLFESHSTQMVLNLDFFRILLPPFWALFPPIWTFLAIFDTSSRVTSRKFFFGWETKPKYIRRRGTHPISTMPHSNVHDFEFFSNSIVHIFGLCFGHFGHFWPFLAFPHVSLPPKFFWVGKLSQNEFDEGAYTLFRICPYFEALFWPFLTFLANINMY